MPTSQGDVVAQGGCGDSEGLSPPGDTRLEMAAVPSSNPAPSTVGWVDFRLFLHFQQKTPCDLLYTFQKYRK
jgi:hypothetical protein